MKGQNTRPNSQKINGPRRSNSRYNNSNNFNLQQQQQQQQNTSCTSSETLGDQKLLFLITKSIGNKCIATVSSGARYQGLLVNADLSSSGSSPLSIVLMNPTTYGKSLVNDKSNVDVELPEKLVIQAKDLIDLEVSDVDLNKTIKKDGMSDQSKQTKSSESKFKTDSDISGRLQFKERVLKKWVPEDNGDSPMLLDDDIGGGHWDQFKVNEDKFGVESTYDEHLYTTRINTSAPDYEERLKKAEKLAKEIENQASNNRHILEERGVQVDDNGVDEEDKYSGVDRRGDELMAALKGTSISCESSSIIPPVPGKYAPPRQRAAQYHNDPAIISSSATNNIKRNYVENKGKFPPIKNQLSDSAFSSGTMKPDSIPPKPTMTKTNESFRLNAQSEINSLREFSANFTIPHKLPTDLLPILAKDTSKQDEILKKQLEQQKLKKDQENQQESINPQKKKMDPTKPAFKLNPKAAVFTPSSKQLSPNLQKANYQKLPNHPSPRIGNQRPYSASNGSNMNTSTKRHHQISPSDFFGSANAVPTKESQDQKRKDFKLSFNLFITAKNRSSGNTPVYEMTFKTPPTWDSTIDEGYDKLFPSLSLSNKGPGMMIPSSPFVPSQLMTAPNIPSGYPGGNKFPMSPQQQHAASAAAMAAHFQQQQQFHAAMMYQQQISGGIPPGQPPILMYPGAEQAFLPPGGFISPPGNFISASGSPVNGNHLIGDPFNGGNKGNYNNNSPASNRRYNNHHNQNNSQTSVKKGN